MTSGYKQLHSDCFTHILIIGGPAFSFPIADLGKILILIIACPMSMADPCFSQGIRYKDGDYQLKQGAGTARPVQVCLCAARHHSFFVDMCREIGLNRASAPLGRAAKGALWFCPFVRERVQERHGNVLVVLFSNHRYEEANGQWKHLTTHFRQKGTTH